jgi:hypothetical protein
VDLDLGAPARDLLDADLLIPRSSGWWATLRLFLTAIYDLGEPSRTVRGELVVTRRDTDATLLRMPADTDVDLPAYVHSQLDQLTVGEFLNRWGFRHQHLTNERLTARCVRCARPGARRCYGLAPMRWARACPVGRSGAAMAVHTALWALTAMATRAAPPKR